MFPQSLSVRSTALVRQRYTELAQRVLHDAEELALRDQRTDPNADEVLISLILAANLDPFLAEFLEHLEVDRAGLAEVIAARIERHNAGDGELQGNSDAYRAWIRVTAMTAPVDLRVMLSSLLISSWIPAVSRVVLEQAGITHDRLIDDLQRHPSSDSADMAALLGADPAGPPLGRVVSADEAIMAIGRKRIVSAAAARFRLGADTVFVGRRGVGKAILARAAAAVSGRLTVEVPMSIFAHLEATEASDKFVELAGYLAARDGGLLVTEADKRVDAYLARVPAGVPVMVTTKTGVRLPQFTKAREPRRLNVPEPTPEVAWHILEAWTEREGIDRRVEPLALLSAISLSHRFLSAGDTALPGSAIELVKHARPIRRDGVIDEAAIEAAVTMTTGLPAAIVSEIERARLNAMHPRLTERIIGQLEAIGVVVKVVRRRAVRLGKEKEKPMGIFIFLGPTGVGKTELARVVAEIVYGSEEALAKFNMGDFQERHEIAKLIGSPPGYVGSDEEGELTKAVRAREDVGGVLLLDEWEKAHPSVANVMLAVYDDGIFVGNKGKPVSLAKWIIIMTSNLGSTSKSGGLGFAAGGTSVSLNAVRRSQRDKLVAEHWRPEFLNRINAVVHFDALTVEELDAVLGLRLETFRADLAGVRLAFKMGPKMRLRMANEAYDSGFGGRDMILRRFPEEVEDRFADILLGEDYAPEACYSLELELDKKANPPVEVPVMTRLMPGDRGYEAPWALPVPAAKKRRVAPDPEPDHRGRNDFMRA